MNHRNFINNGEIRDQRGNSVFIVINNHPSNTTISLVFRGVRRSTSFVAASQPHVPLQCVSLQSMAIIYYFNELNCITPVALFLFFCECHCALRLFANKAALEQITHIHSHPHWYTYTYRHALVNMPPLLERFFSPSASAKKRKKNAEKGADAAESRKNKLAQECLQLRAATCRPLARTLDSEVHSSTLKVIFFIILEEEVSRKMMEMTFPLCAGLLIKKKEEKNTSVVYLYYIHILVGLGWVLWVILIRVTHVRFFALRCNRSCRTRAAMFGKKTNVSLPYTFVHIAFSIIRTVEKIKFKCLWDFFKFLKKNQL